MRACLLVYANVGVLLRGVYGLVQIGDHADLLGPTPLFVMGLQVSCKVRVARRLTCICTAVYSCCTATTKKAPSTLRDDCTDLPRNMGP